MASCSLYHPGSFPLLTRAELESILLFERVVGDWVREVHMFTSKRKSGYNFVIFRNSSNTRIRGVEAFHSYLVVNGFDASFLSTAVFKSDKAGSIVCNKVGANVTAKKEALMWVQDVRNNKVDKLSQNSANRQTFRKETLKNKSSKNKGIMKSEDKEQIMKENSHVSRLSNIEENKNIRTEFGNFAGKLYRKEKEDGLEQFPNNDGTFWMGDKLDMLIDGEISEEEDKTVEQSMKTESKTEKISIFNLGSIDYSWMDSFGCDSDQEVGNSCGGVDEEESNKTLELGPIDYSWMESLADDLDSDDANLKVIEHDAKKEHKKLDKIEFSSIDYSWMDSMGCVSEIEEDGSQMESNSRNIQSGSEMDDYGNHGILDTRGESKKGYPENVNEEKDTRKSSQSSDAEENDEHILSAATDKCGQWVFKNMQTKEDTSHKSFNHTILMNSGTQEMFQEETSEIHENKPGRDQENNEIVDVGDFCSAWMDCFESITKLDNNLKVKLESTPDTVLINESSSDPGSSSILEKDTKNGLNHKIAKVCSDSSRNIIEDKENEMFKLLEEVLLRGDVVEDKHEVFIDGKQLSSETNDKNDDKKELDVKTTNVCNFVDAGTIQTELEGNLKTLSNQKYDERIQNSFDLNVRVVKNTGDLFSCLNLSSNNNCKPTSSSPALEDSDSSYMDEAESSLATMLRNKKQKRRKLLKGKLKMDDHKIRKGLDAQNPCRKSTSKVGIKKTLNSEGKELIKRDLKRLHQSQPSNGNVKLNTKSGPSQSQYSSDWETDEDEDDIGHKSSDDMEDV